jgi:hypothetical protein
VRPAIRESSAAAVVEGLPVDMAEAEAAAEDDAVVLATLLKRASFPSSKGAYNSVEQVLLVDTADDLLDLLADVTAAVVVVVVMSPGATATAVAIVLCGEESAP